MIPLDIFHEHLFSEEILFFLPKIIIATVCGGLIGIERGLRRSVAGLRTNILICVGSAILTAFGLYASEELRRAATEVAGTAEGLGGYADPIRLWGQIITGIGFLGGGVIFMPLISRGAKGQEGGADTPRGVTTAAYIWFNCGIGMMIGYGLSALAALITIGLIAVMLTIEIIEDKILYGAKKLVPKKITASHEDDGKSFNRIEEKDKKVPSDERKKQPKDKEDLS